jgi:uncharacterized protein YkwD
VVDTIARMKRMSLSILLLLGACVVGDEADFQAPDDQVVSLAITAPLTSGQPLTGLAATQGQELAYAIDVPAGATELRFAITGGTGDADLYVKFGAAPTRTSYDYRPYLNGNAETVTPTPIRTGTYFVMLRAYASFSGVTLTASFTAPTTPPPPPPPPPTGPDCHVASSWPAAWVTFEDQVLALINQRRAAGATCGGVPKPPVGAVVVDAALRQAARCHSLDMAVHGYFSHTSQDGSSPWDRIAVAGYTASPTGENIAAGYGTAQAVVDGWMTSTGHCNNIMNGGSNETGVGYAYQQGSPYGAYWTQTFGRR